MNHYPKGLTVVLTLHPNPTPNIDHTKLPTLLTLTPNSNFFALSVRRSTPEINLYLANDPRRA